MEKKMDIRKAIVLNTLSVFIYFFVQWLLTVVVTRLSGYENAGYFTLAVSFSNIFCYISNFGVRNVQISDTARKYDRNTYFTSRILTSSLSIIVFFFVIVIVDYEVTMTRCCVAMICYKILESYSDVLMGELQLLNRYDCIAFSTIGKSVLVLILPVLILLRKMPLPLCIWGMCIGYAVILLSYDMRILDMYRSFRWSAGNVKKLLITSFPLTISAILDAVILFVPKHFVETLMGSTTLGYYGTVTIVIVVLQTLGSSVWSSMIPVYSRCFLDNDDRQIRKLTRNVVILMIVFSILMLTIGRMVAPFFYVLLFGEQIRDYMFLLPSVIINSLLLLYNSYFVCFLVPLKKNHYYAVSDVIAVVILIPLCWLFVRNYGLSGASYSLSVALFVKFMILLFGTIVSVKNRQG